MAKISETKDTATAVTSAHHHIYMMFNNWIEQNVVENRDEMISIADIATSQINSKLHINIPHEHSALMVIIYDVFMQKCIDHLQKQLTKYDNYALSILNNLIIGYENHIDDDMDKYGSFLPDIVFQGQSIPFDESTIQFTQVKKSNKHTFDAITSAWTRINMPMNITAIQDIVSATIIDIRSTAVKLMANSGSTIRDPIIIPPEIILPIVSFFHDAIINYMVINKSILSPNAPYALNILNLYKVILTETNNIADSNFLDKYFVTYQPLYRIKLSCKSDTIAGAKNV